MYKNSVEPCRSQLTIWRMRIAYWIPKATNIHSEYVIRTPFSQQQWLHERASLLRYTYIACLVILLFVKPSHFKRKACHLWKLNWIKIISKASVLISQKTYSFSIKMANSSILCRKIIHLTFRWPCIVINSYNKPK